MHITKATVTPTASVQNNSKIGTCPSEALRTTRSRNISRAAPPQRKEFSWESAFVRRQQANEKNAERRKPMSTRRQNAAIFTGDNAKVQAEDECA